MSATKLPFYRFEGEVTVPAGQSYHQDYLQCPFEVPPGTASLRLRLSYSPLEVDGVANLITLGLFDPHGFRGNAHCYPPHPEEVISAGSATPGFIPGPVQAGTWLAQLAVQAVVAGEQPCRYTLEVELLAEEEHQDNLGRRWSLPAWQAATTKAGWYKGELHSHTLHSDGSLTLEELIALAQQQQLDFLAITDHNTVSALGEIQNNVRDGLLLIPGMELTTFYGHALALGVDCWLDWRVGFNGWTMEDAARLTRSLGGLFIIAHPQDIGSPICTGCRWEYSNFDLELADAIEIWNGGWRLANLANLEQWQALQGTRRIPATCGCDIHSPEDWKEGMPFLYVYAGELSIPAVLEGLRQGKVVISNGPWLELTLSAGEEGGSAGIGEALRLSGEAVQWTVEWRGAPAGARLVARNQQAPWLEQAASGEGVRRGRLPARPGDRLWLELYGADDSLLALTNPVFILW